MSKELVKKMSLIKNIFSNDPDDEPPIWIEVHGY